MKTPSVRVVELHEREMRLFPRGDLIDGHGRSLILPETRSLKAIELSDMADGIRLRVLGLIGYLPLTNDIVLNLRPKFPTDNLWRMLDVADEAYERILPVLRSYQSADVTAPHQLLARAFCHYLREILSGGVMKGYHRERYQGYFKPKVEFGETVARYTSRGNDVQCSSNVFTFSWRLPVNGYLKSACIQLLRIVPRTSEWLSERMLLLEALRALESVPQRQMRPTDLAVVDLVPMRVRDSYRGALTVYSVFLGYTRVGFSYDAEGSEMPSFLFSLDDIFERFVRNTLREGLRYKGFSVVNGNETRHQEPLFRDNKRFPVKPDIVFRKAKVTRAIGEVKYKPKIEEADRYQVISHSIACSAPLAFWISPALTEQDAGLVYIGSITGGIRFFHYRLNISGILDTSCDIMIEDIAHALETLPPIQVDANAALAATL